jgi:hypothetical protein
LRRCGLRMGILLRGGKTGRWVFGLVRRCVRDGMYK